MLGVVLFGVIWFSMIGHRDLFDPDEGRYAGIPAAMDISGDWLTPRLNGFKYFEKPALQYWATAAIYKVFGKSNATSRLWTAMTGFATALFVMFLSYRLHGRKAAYYTFMITISSCMVVAFGQILTLDMSLSMFVVVAVGSLVIAQVDRSNDEQTRNWMLIGWAALALGTLTKGLVAVALPVLTAVVYSLWQRDLDLWKRLHLFKGLLLFLLITAPWFIAVSLENPEFARFFFIHEHFDRYTSDSHNREGPIYYFVPFLIIGVMPWLFTSLRSILQPGFKWLPDKPGHFDVDRFLWTFIIITFCFFSFGQSKLPGYILPILPVIAVISGKRIALRNGIEGDRWVMFLLGSLLLVLAYNIEYLSSNSYPLQQWVSYAPWLAAAGVLYLLSSMMLSIRKNGPILVFANASFMSLTASILIISGSNSLSESRSGKAMANAITASIPAGAPIFAFQNYSESAVFYLGRPITVVEYKGELAMGIKSEPHKFVATQERFIEIWQALDQAAVMVKFKRLPNLNIEALNGKVVYKGPKSMVIIKS